MTNLPIGVQIRSLREERGWTLAELAARAGTSASALHRYESGWDRFELATLRRLARALEARLEVSLEVSLEAEPGRAREGKPRAEALVRLLEPLFWDHELEAGDLEAHPLWVLRRVLIYGDRRQVAASRRFFGDEAIRAAVAHRETDERTRNFWTLVLGSGAGEEAR